MNKTNLVVRIKHNNPNYCPENNHLELSDYMYVKIVRDLTSWTQIVLCPIDLLLFKRTHWIAAIQPYVKATSEANTTCKNEHKYCIVQYYMPTSCIVHHWTMDIVSLYPDTLMILHANVHEGL